MKGCVERIFILKSAGMLLVDRVALILVQQHFTDSLNGSCRTWSYSLVSLNAMLP